METSEDEMLGNELKKNQNQSVDYICQNCEKMEFEPGPVSSTDNFYNPIFEWEDTASTSNCAMCNAFRLISQLANSRSSASHRVYKVPNIVMQYLPNRSDEPEDIVLQNLERINAARWLCMLPTASNPPTKVFNFYLSARLGCLTESTIQGADIPEPRVNEIRRDEIHYDKIRCWIDDCMSSHLGNCTKRVELPVHHLNLIDCESRCIVTAKPGFRYSALSYVWGPSPDGTGTIRVNGLPSSIPKTIEDAMAVNGQLGIHYLWVDRYCILDSGGHKAEQIGNT